MTPRQRERGTTAPPSQEGGLNQEGSVDDVEVRRRVLRRVDLRPEYFGNTDDLGDGRRAGRDSQRDAQRNMGAGQNARRRCGDHVLAAIVFMVGRIARHRPAAFHRLLVEGHGLAFRELHQQHHVHRHNETCNLPKHHPGP